ncbi:MAG: O-antigen ligase family protein [Alphaproteobacteria bacterium]
MLSSFVRFARATNSLELAWVLLWCATLSFTQRTAAESLYGGIDAVHLQRYVFDAAALAFTLMNAGRLRTLKWDPITFFLVYVLFGVVSTSWSVGPLATAAKSGELLIGVLIVSLTLVKRDPLTRLRRLIDWLAVLLGGLLVVVLAGFIVAPESFSIPSLGVLSRQLQAPVISSNGISAASAFLCLLCFARYLAHPRGSTQRLRYLLLYFFFIVFPILAQGRTGQAMVVAGTAFLLLRRTPGIALLLVVPPAAFFAFTFATEVATFFTRGQQEAQFTGLSGRLILWQWAWEAAQDHPFFGVGFGVGSRHLFAQGTGFFGETISSVHNGFLEVLLGTGLAGFAFWAVSFLWGVRLAAASYMGGQNLDVCMLFVYLLGTTIMSIGVGGWMGAPTAVFLVATAYLHLARRGVQPAAAAHPPRARGRRPLRPVVTGARMVSGTEDHP